MQKVIIYLLIGAFSFISSTICLAQSTLIIVDAEPIDGPGDNLIFSARRNVLYSLTMGFDTNELVVHEVGRNSVLTHVGNLPAGKEPRQVAVARNGKYIVHVNSVSNELNVHKVKKDGSLESVGTTPSIGNDPWDIAVAYNDVVVATNRGSNTLDTYHIDKRGRLHSLDSAPTGMLPHVVSVTRNGLVAVGNSISNDIDVFTVSRRGEIDPVQTLPTGTQPRSIAIADDAMFAAVVSTQPTVIEDEIQTFSIERDKGITTIVPTGNIPCGLFLTDIAVVGKWLFAATVNANIRDEIRVYRREGTQLTLETSIELPDTTPSFKQITAEKGEGPVLHHVLVTEYQDDVIHSIEHRKP